MASFGTRSLAQLRTCDVRLQQLFKEVVKRFDCSVLEGHRNEERQNMLYDMEQSKVKFPVGKHNSNPSKAVDVAPYPIDWDNRERFVLFAGFVLGIANEMGIPIRWGGDWDGDWDTKETSFFDAPHFEIDE
jgi:peptidoglycan LD-endopeptidase CwlK